MEKKEEELLMRFRNISSYLSNQLNHYGKKFHLTGIQCMILGEIGQNQNITISQLCAHLNLTKANLSAILRRMESKGWICKERSQEDQRLVFLTLTKAGQDIYEQLKSDVEKHFPAWNYLDPKKQEIILEGLKTLEELIKEVK